MPHLGTAFVFSAFLAAASALSEPVRGLPSLTVPEGFTVEIAAGPELTAYPMFMAFDPQGRMYIAESSGKDLSGKEMIEAPECTILMLEDENGDGVFDKRTVYADKLTLPMGVLWHDGSIYTAAPPDFIRLKDNDGDGVAEEREVILSGWNMLNTASLHGPYLGPDGFMYLTHGRHGYKIQSKEGELLEGGAARIWRCKPDGTQLERYCGGGFDNPVEIIFTEPGELIGTMTYFVDPQNGQRDALMHWVEGGVYPKVHEVLDEFPRTGDLLPPLTKFARIAPAGLERYRSPAFGAEYQGSLFSAQFNPHRVQRHVITREGATFTSVDTDFLTSIDPDFHPTDVLEDADGSLLVSDTGGWYVDACPVSRVAKPELRGTIYRIRKTGAHALEDPRGLKLDWASPSADDLIARLADARPVVRDRAVAQLPKLGSAAIAPLAALLQSDAPASTRLLALQALNQIGGEAGLQAIIPALGDEHEEVQIAAANLLGAAKHAPAVEGLARLVLKGSPSAQRQAALALARLGKPEVTSELLYASNGEHDAHLSHALIHALVQLGDTVALAEGLKDPDAGTRRAALIALDQTKALTEAQFAPSLEDPDARVRQAALWVASHHAEWGDTVAAFLDRSLNEWSAEKGVLVTDALATFAGDARVQSTVARLLADTALPERAQFLLDTVERSPVSPLPEPWVNALSALLDTPDAALRLRAIAVIQARNVEAHDKKLAALGADDNLDDLSRIMALNAAAPRLGSLPEKLYDYITSRIGEGHEAPLRQAAARLLARVELSAAQARDLADKHVPEADALTFTHLLAAVGKQTDKATGMALVEGLTRAKYDVNRVPPREIARLFDAYPAAVQKAAEPIRAKAATLDAARVAKLEALVPRLGTGDVGRGRQTFFGAKVACSTCHAIGTEGGRLGPDLTTIGLVRSGHDLLEALLFPNASIVQGYETHRVETLDGALLLGVIKRQTADGITLQMAADSEAYVALADVITMEQYPLSLMPEGLDTGLTEDELIDLVTFLQSLNNDNWLLPVAREK